MIPRQLRGRVLSERGRMVIYDRLGPGLRDELEDYAGRDEKGRLKHRLHQYLTSSHGLPELQGHLAGVVALF